MRERGFAFQPVWVVARRDQQGRGGVRPNAVDVEEARRGSPDELVDQLVEGLRFGFEIKDSSTKGADREFRRVQDRSRGQCRS